MNRKGEAGRALMQEPALVGPAHPPSALRQLWGTGDCAVLLSIAAQKIVQGRCTYEEAERMYGTREVNVDGERRCAPPRGRGGSGCGAG